MKATAARSSGGAQYPYPREVWSPAGGWWTRPSSWKSNTAIVFTGVVGLTYAIWTLSAEKEIRHTQPTRWIPSMLWAKQFTTGEMRVPGTAPQNTRGEVLEE